LDVDVHVRVCRSSRAVLVVSLALVGRRVVVVGVAIGTNRVDVKGSRRRSLAM